MCAVSRGATGRPWRAGAKNGERHLLLALLEGGADAPPCMHPSTPLTVGTFVKILEEDFSIVGCLYDSSEKLKGTYVQLSDTLLHPAVLSPACSSFHLMPKTFNRCNKQRDYRTQGTCGICHG